jgi:hypothetical protein
MPALEKKKEQLEKIRNFYQPIGKEEYEQH